MASTLVIYTGISIIGLGGILILAGLAVVLRQVRKVKMHFDLLKSQGTPIGEATEFLKALKELFNVGGWGLVLLALGGILILIGAGLVGLGSA